MKTDALREAILTLLRKRQPGASICPSEAARYAYPDDWREHMEAIREETLALVDEGIIDICQGGKPISPTQEFKGPIRLRLKTKADGVEH